MTNSLPKYFAAVLSCLVGFSTNAIAAELYVTPNRGYANDVFINPGTDIARTALQAGRSYECSIITREYDAALPKKLPAFNPTVIQPNSVGAAGSFLGTLKPGLAAPVSLAAQRTKLRIGFLATQTGIHTLSFQDAAGSGTAIPGSSVRCVDTTLYGGFNRFFAGIAVVELSNNTLSALQAAITIVDFAGNVLINQQPTTIAANNRTDIVFASLPAERFGQILVTSVSSAGALSGYVSEYDQLGDGSLVLKRERPLSLGAALP